MDIVYDCTQKLFVRGQVDKFNLKGEDFHCVQPENVISALVEGVPAEVNCAIFGVFDGHGGKQASQFSSKQVPSRLLEKLRGSVTAALSEFSLRDYLDLGDGIEPRLAAQWLLEDAVVRLLPRALCNVFVEVHDDFVLDHEASGTTATVCVFVGTELVVANVGDSLAFLDTGAAVLQVSGNHRIDDNKAERQRIKDAGGAIDQADLDGRGVGPLRVWPGGLAFSRSIGDARAGDLVPATPEVRQVTIGSKGARVLFGSDGIWDAVQGKNGCRSLVRRVRSLPCTKAAPSVKSFAKNARDRDDITAIVVDVLPDADVVLPPALIETSACGQATPHESAQGAGSCSASLASSAAFETAVGQVWRPLDVDADRVLDFHRAKMLRRSASLDAAAAQLSSSLASADLQDAGAESDLSAGGSDRGELCDESVNTAEACEAEDRLSPLYMELTNLRVDPESLMGAFETEDAGNWETVGAKRSTGTPAARPDGPRGKGRGRGRSRQARPETPAGREKSKTGGGGRRGRRSGVDAAGRGPLSAVVATHAHSSSGEAATGVPVTSIDRVTGVAQAPLEATSSAANLGSASNVPGLPPAATAAARTGSAEAAVGQARTVGTGRDGSRRQRGRGRGAGAPAGANSGDRASGSVLGRRGGRGRGRGQGRGRIGMDADSDVARSQKPFTDGQPEAPGEGRGRGRGRRGRGAGRQHTACSALRPPHGMQMQQHVLPLSQTVG